MAMPATAMAECPVDEALPTRTDKEGIRAPDLSACCPASRLRPEQAGAIPANFAARQQPELPGPAVS